MIIMSQAWTRDFDLDQHRFLHYFPPYILFIVNMYWDYVYKLYILANKIMSDSVQFGANVWCTVTNLLWVPSRTQLLKTHSSVFKKNDKMSSEKYSLMLRMIDYKKLPCANEFYFILFYQSLPNIITTIAHCYELLSHHSILETFTVFVVVSAIDCYTNSQILILSPAFQSNITKCRNLLKNVQIFCSTAPAVCVVQCCNWRTAKVRPLCVYIPRWF